jgi:hypothetical protein
MSLVVYHGARSSSTVKNCESLIARYFGHNRKYMKTSFSSYIYWTMWSICGGIPEMWLSMVYTTSQKIVLV